MDNGFNPNDLSIVNGNYFALPFPAEQCELVIISAAWDVTVSYREGTSLAPDAIIDASSQVDLYDIHNPNGYKKGIGTVPIDEDILQKSRSLRKDAVKVIDLLSEGRSVESEAVAKRLSKINEGSCELNNYIYKIANEWMDKGKKIALVGGDHSVPFGFIKALGEKYNSFSILHIDAHADLRDKYEGFDHSHASIMNNVIHKIESVNSLVQVGIRDFCEDELDLINSNAKISTFFDANLQSRKFEGESWASICDDIISSLKDDDIYISFDIDGLTPDNCPSTGTPVPGGLSFSEAVYLINRATERGKNIIGFDLVEVAPSLSDDNEWDANVGARMLYKLCNLALK